MVPIHARRVIVGELVFVVEGTAGAHGDEDVVPVAFGRHVEAMHMQVGGPDQLVDELKLQGVAGA